MTDTANNPTPTTGPPGYGTAGPIYFGNGWQPFPLPAGAKAPPPTGYTGADAKHVTIEDVQRWAAEHVTGNVGLHLQRGIIGIDIDAYAGKNGRETIEQLEERLGKLPATLTSTSRSDGVSRIAFYRVPATREYIADLGHGSGVEIIQWRHRYACVSPSRHPDTGEMYRWMDNAGNRVLIAGVTPDMCALLPEAWVEYLTMRAPEPRPERPKVANTPMPSSSTTQPDSIAQWVCDNHRWGEILTLDGWTYSHNSGEDQHWTRPGKQRGTSAVLHGDGDGPLVVFSTDAATSPLWQHGVRSANGDVVSLSLFHYLTATRYHGNASACASAYRVALNRDQANSVTYGTSNTAHAVLDGNAGDVEATEPQEWGEIDPIGGDTELLPPFPVEVFPAWIAEHVEQVAHELQVPVDLPAMLALTALSTAAAKRAEVFLTRTWREQLCLYLVCALPPGAGKSPAFSQMLGPLNSLEAELLAEAAGRIAEQRTRRAVAEKLYKKAIDNATTGFAEALAAGDDLARHVVEPEPRLFVDDVTVEKMGAMMRDQGGRLAIVSTEGGLFDQMAGRYNDKSKASLDPYLQMWSGDTVRVDRIGRDSVVIDKPALTIGITVQPSVLQALAERPELKGRGLTARFMYSLPASNVGYRNMTTEAHLAADIAERYDDNLRRLWRSMADLVPPMRVEIDPDAKAVFLAWRQELEIQRRPGGALVGLTEWSTKVESSVARVAGLLHLAAGKGAAPVDLDDMAAALTVGRYWIEHAHAVHQMWATDDTLEVARRIVAWIRGRDLVEFTVRDCHRAHHRLVGSVDDLVDPLALLVDKSYVRTGDGQPLSVGKRGVPSQTLVVNPSLSAVPSHNRHNHVTMSTMSLEIQKTESLSLSLGSETRTPGDMGDMVDNCPEGDVTEGDGPEPPEPVDNSTTLPDLEF